MKPAICVSLLITITPLLLISCRCSQPGSSERIDNSAAATNYPESARLNSNGSSLRNAAEGISGNNEPLTPNSEFGSAEGSEFSPRTQVNRVPIEREPDKDYRAEIQDLLPSGGGNYAVSVIFTYAGNRKFRLTVVDVSSGKSLAEEEFFDISSPADNRNVNFRYDGTDLHNLEFTLIELPSGSVIDTWRP